MIKNSKQYAVTVNEISKFRTLLADAVVATRPDDLHPKMWESYLESIESQIATLEREVREFDALRSGDIDRIEVSSLEELPLGLIKARIVKGWTHQQLADRIHVKAQQVQRWENQDYETVGFNRLVQIADALGVDVSESISFRQAAPNAVAALKRLGLDKAFLRRRIAPYVVADDHSLITASADFLKRIWGLVVRGNGTLDMTNFARVAAAGARFKLPKNADPTKVQTYSQYAFFIASRVCEAFDGPIPEVSRDWRLVRHRLAGNGELSLRTCLNKVWALGIPVIPLCDPVRFHGACWKINGRAVIVLKQTLRNESRWLFDLIHELYHAGELADVSFRTVADDPVSVQRRESEDEQAAHRFAGDVLLNGRADALFSEALKVSNRQIALLKRAVQEVATRNKANVGILANYVAYRLSEEGVDWWGTAANLQPDSDDAFAVASSVFRAQFDLSRLSPNDQTVIELAISEPNL